MTALRQFLDDCLKGNRQKVLDFLSSNPEAVNQSSPDFINGGTPLYLATREGHIDLVQLLLEKGANVNGRNVIGATALHIAIQKSSGPIIRKLMQAGADPNVALNQNAGPGQGSTPLFIAIQRGLVPMVELLLEYNPNLTCRTILGENVLYMSIRFCQWKTLDLLLNHLKQHDHLPELLGGLTQGNQSLIEAFCSTISPPDVNAARRVVDEMLRHLGDNKVKELANLPRKSDTVRPFSILGENEKVRAIAKLLLEKKLVDQPSLDWGLFLSSQEGGLEFCKLCVEHHANLDVHLFQGITPLMTASKNGKIRVVEFLLEKGAKLEERSPMGCTALWLAAQNGHSAICKLLLDKGADPRTCVEWSKMQSSIFNGPLPWNGTCSAKLKAALKGHSGTVQLITDYEMKKYGKAEPLVDHLQALQHLLTLLKLP